MGDFVRLEHDAFVSTITIARPDKLNALDEAVLGDLAEALEQLRNRAETRCAILTGEGKAFVAGADIAAMKDLPPVDAERLSKLGHDTLGAIEALAHPVIAAVNGFALGGGCELALACDFIYASEKAKLGQPEVKLGVIPGFGGTQRLTRRVGIGVARELVYTGGMIGAEEALRVGLVNKVLPPDELLPAARKTADTIAAMGPLAVAEAKRMIRDGADRLLPEANALEVEAFAGLFSSSDQKEGMDAFLSKRDPSFTGE